MERQETRLRTNELIQSAFVLLLLLPGVAQAHETKHHSSPYAGQETRQIKSLSPEDIAELRRGGGWGLARAAELNGVPGPAHLLELKDAIPLDPQQVAAIRSIHDAMRTEAIAEGEKFIALERELENHFRNGTITDAILQQLLDEIATSQRRLRYIHLSIHLRMPALLTKDQIAKYNVLRGYKDDDPCSHVPGRHDPELWRKHNRC
jgi:hypothetical protein